MSSTRQLAAIMFTDIVGYTSLMGKDEARALEILETNRNIQKPLIKRHGGRFLKEVGDGILASFPAASDAVMCAGSIQHASGDHPGLQLRIGIHVGEVVFENDDVFGDGVNIASRISDITPPGSIWITDPVRSNIRNKPGVTTEFRVEEELKNVDEPIRLYEVIVEMEPGMEGGPPTQQSSIRPKRRVAVLLYTLAIIALFVVIYFAVVNTDRRPGGTATFTAGLDRAES